MIEQVVVAVILPALVAGVVLLLGWRPWRRRPESGRLAASSTALAFALAFAVSFVSKNWPTLLSSGRTDDAGAEAGPLLARVWRGSVEAFSPSSKQDWILYLALVAGAIGLVAAVVRKPVWLRWLAGVAVAGATWWLIQPLDNPTYALLGLPGLAGVTLVLWLALEPLAARRRGVSLPLAFMILFSGVAAVVFNTGGLTMPLVCGALAGVCGAAVVVALLDCRFSLARGATPFLACVPATVLWLQAWYYYGDASWYAFPLALLAIPLLWLGELPVVIRRGPLTAVVIRAALVAIPVAAAVVLTLETESDDPYDGLYGARPVSRAIDQLTN